MLDILLDALIDTLKTLPFLFGAYLLIEFLEHRASEKLTGALRRLGPFGPVGGAVLGLVPQCGFSVAAANFYAGRLITPGTLVAVFLATSDEAIPMLLAVPDQWPRLALLIAVKIGVALLAGLVLDVLLVRFLPRSLRGGYTGHADEVDCHEHHAERQSIFISALWHTFIIFLYILGFSFAIGFVMELVGEEVFTTFLANLGVFQPIFAALIGLVPNCAASVLLTQLYLGGSISFGAAVAGLCSGAGVGLVVLCQANKSWKQNLFIIGLLWGAGAVTGMALQLLGV